MRTAGIATWIILCITFLFAGCDNLLIDQIEDDVNYSEDANAPDAPVVIGHSPTNDATPVWEWDIPVGAVEFRCRMQDGDWMPAQTSYTPSSDLQDGDHTLSVQAKNSAGAWSQSGSKTITVDTLAPTAPSVGGIAGTNDSTPTWSCTVPADAVDVRYKIDDGNWVYVGNAVFPSFTPASALADGSHTLFVQVIDAAGNWSAIGGFSVLIDSTAPNAPSKPDLSAFDDTGAYNDDDITNITSALSISGSCEVGATIELFADSNSLGIVTASGVAWSFEVSLSPGTYLISAVARDTEGNQSFPSMDMNLVIDITPPVLSVNATMTNDTAPELSGSVDDPDASIDLQVDGLPYTAINNGDGTWVLPDNDIAPALTDGTYDVQITGTDLAGNADTDSTSDELILETIAPQITGLSDDATPTQSKSWSWGSDDPAAIYRNLIDTNPTTPTDWSGASWGSETTAIKDMVTGDYYLHVQAIDVFGNVASENVSAVLDNTPPTTPVITGPSVTADTTPTWSWSNPADAADLRYQYDGGGWITTGGTSMLSFTPVSLQIQSDHLFEVQVVDLAGNWSIIGSYTITVLLAAPSNPTPADNGSVYVENPLLDWADMPGAVSYEIQVSDTLGALQSSPVETSLSSEFQVTVSFSSFADYYWRARLKNDDGVYGDWSNDWQFEVFVRPTKYVIASGTNGYKFHLNDIDADTDIDIVVGTTFGGTTVQWLENDGSLTFLGNIIDNTLSLPSSVYSGDIDGDGDIDVVAPEDNNPANMYWYENDGNESFTRRTVVESANASFDFCSLYDFNSDGSLEILTASGTGLGFGIWMNDGNEMFTYTSLGGSNCTTPFPVDLDDDGDTDILIASFADSVYWYENDGANNFTQHALIGSPPPMECAYGDFDNDADIDIITGHWPDGDLYVFLNDGSENFTKVSVPTTMTSYSRGFHPVDMDKDGYLDIMVSATQNNKVLLYRNSGGANFKEYIVDEGIGRPWGIASYDLDGNGDLEVVVAIMDDNDIVYYDFNL